MKYLMLSIATLTIFSLSSFTTKSEFVNSNAEEAGTVPCKWRTVYYHSDGAVSYSQWTSGNCNQSEDGSLHPIR